MSQTILYDLPSKPPCESWSLNPIKTRMILSYKGIPYETEWIEYPDLAPKLKSYGLPPNDKNGPGYSADYTSPAIRLEDGTLVMDSWNIAQELEKRYPNPSLHMDDPIILKVRDMPVVAPLRKLILPKVPRNLLNESSAEYFYRTREAAFGMPLDQLEKEQDVEKCWEEVKGLAKDAGELLRQNGGPFFLGKTVSYADFIFVSILQYLKRVDPAIFDRYLKLDDSFSKIYDASAPWLKQMD